jgi:hypothetical protein
MEQHELVYKLVGSCDAIGPLSEAFFDSRHQDTLAPQLRLAASAMPRNMEGLHDPDRRCLC